MVVLFVEDNVSVRTAVVDALDDAEFEVTTASGAEAALALIAEQDFDVLVTDIHLDTELAGLDVATSWRNKHPDKPIIFATAYPRSDIKLVPLRQNDGYLVKPFSPGELLALIQFVVNLPATTAPKSVAGTIDPPKSGGGAGDVEADRSPWLS